MCAGKPQKKGMQIVYLPEKILWAVRDAGRDGICEVDIFCDASIRGEVVTFFQETFERYWSEVLDKVEALEGDCWDKDEGRRNPAYIVADDKCVRIILLDSLDIYVTEECTDGCMEGHRALKKTLRKLIRSYPDVSYEGYVGYAWFESCGSEITQYELSSQNPTGRDETDNVYDLNFPHPNSPQTQGVQGF